MRTILLITEPAEAAALRAALQPGPGERLRVRTLEDLSDDEPPTTQLLRERPAALVLGTGALGIDIAAYLHAAREHLPGCVVCLLCYKNFARAARKLGPDRVLLRPVTGPELWEALQALWHAVPQSATVAQIIHDPIITIDLGGEDSGAMQVRPVDAPAGRARTVSAETLLLRADELLPDPLLMFRDPAPVPAVARRRTATHTGEITIPFRRGVRGARAQPEESPVASAQRSEGPYIDGAQRSEAPFIDLTDSGRIADPYYSEVEVTPDEPSADTLDEDLELLEGTDEPTVVAGPRGVGRGQGATPVRIDSSETPLPPPRPLSGSTPSQPTLSQPAPSGISARSLPPPLPPLLPGAEGDLGASEPPVLIGRLCTSGFTGCLQLVREGDGGAERNLFFEFGALCAASSTVPLDSLPELLFNEGRLSREQLKRARQVVDAGRAAGFGCGRLAQQLSQEQLLPRGEVQPLLRRQVIEIFYRSLLWEKGRYHLLPRTAPAEDRVQLREPVKLLLLEGLRKKASLEALVPRVGTEGAVLLPTGDGPALLKDAGVTTFEQRALPLFDGQHSLAQIAAQSGLAEHATYVLAYALICLGGLRRPSPGRRSHPIPAPRQRARGTGEFSAPQRDSGGVRTAADSAQRSGPQPLPQPLMDSTLSWLRGQQRLIDDADYFTLLGLPPSASASDVQRAYEALRRELQAPGLLAQGEVQDQLQRVRLAVDEAYGVLSDDQMRESYRAHLVPLP